MSMRFKSRIIAILLLVCLALPVLLGGCTADTNIFLEFEKKKFEEFRFKTNDTMTVDPNPADETAAAVYKLALESADLKLYMNTDTTSFVVVDKRTGKQWFSNPNVADMEVRFKSMLSITAYDDKDSEDTRDTFMDAVNVELTKKDEEKNNPLSTKQFEFTKTDDGKGLAVVYRLGKITQAYAVPRAIDVEQFEEWLNSDLITDREKMKLKLYYTKIDESFWSDPDNKESIAKYKKTFPLCDSVPQYVFKNSNDLSFRTIEPILKTLGFDVNKAREMDTKFQVKPQFVDTFQMQMEFRLDNDSMQVTVPLDKGKLWYQDKMYYLSEINMLKYFGAGTVNDNGYILLPDKAGALINFNNKKNNFKNDIVLPVYGTEPTTYNKNIGSSTSRTNLPVFGIKNGDSAVLAIIEEGREMATIRANIADPSLTASQTVNYAYANFTVRSYTKIPLRIRPDRTINKYQKETYQGNVTMRYAFMAEGKSDYSGMAAYYRDYLVKNGMLGKEDVQIDNLPFTAEFLGAIEVKRTIAGFPMNITQPLTKFDDAQALIKQLQAGGVKNINIKYLGWANGGMLNGYFANVNAVPQIGGNKGFERLAKFAKDNNIGLFPDAEVMYVYESADTLFDGFGMYNNGARFVDAKVAKKFQEDIMLQQIRRNRHTAIIVKPDDLIKTMDKLLPRYQKKYGNSMALSALGEELIADYNEKNNIFRSETRQMLEKELQKYVDSGMKLMMDGGNDYALKYISVLANAPTSSSNYYMADAEVPFYSMVMHGHLVMVSEPLNQQDEPRIAFLKAVESGVGFSYKLMGESNEVLWDVDAFNLYGLNFTSWDKQIVEYYNEANSKLAGLFDQEIKSHRKLDNTEVYITTYANGKSVIVNYTDKDITVAGKNVKALGFEVANGRVD